MKKSLWILVLLMLFVCTSALADVYVFDNIAEDHSNPNEAFSLRYPHGWEVTEELNKEAHEYFLGFDGTAQDRQAVEVYATYTQENDTWLGSGTDKNVYKEELMKAYAAYQAEIVAELTPGIVWKGVAEQGPIMGISAEKEGGWHFTFIIHAWADDSRTAYRELDFKDIAQLRYFFDHTRAGLVHEDPSQFVNQPLTEKPYVLVTYKTSDGEEVPYGMPGEFMDESRTVHTEKNGREYIEVYEDTDKKYLEKYMVITYDEKKLPVMAIYDAKGSLDEKTRYNYDEKVWISENGMVTIKSYVDENGEWVKDRYYAGEFVTRTWFEGDNKMVASYREGKIERITVHQPDGVEVTTNAHGEMTGKEYYDERGLKLQENYNNGVLSSCTYDDDNGMQASALYNSKGELVDLTYYYYDLEGNRQKYEVPLKNVDMPDDLNEDLEKTYFEGDMQITEQYTPEGKMYARYTIAPESNGTTNLATNYIYQYGELVDVSVYRFPADGGSGTLVSWTYWTGAEWIMETYDENGNVLSTEVVSKPE